MKTEAEVAERFTEIVAEHEMAILHDEGLYRHLRFAAPGTYIYGFDIVTWPGHLHIDGDLDSGLTFSRVEDMLDFFFSGPSINPQYWAEKITNRDAMAGTRIYSERKFQDVVIEQFRQLSDYFTPMQERVIRTAWDEHVSYRDTTTEHGAHEAMQSFEVKDPDFRFMESWEFDFREWSPHYLLTCHALRWGAHTYVEATE